MKVYFHTFGCKVNQYETQLLREQALKAEYNQTDNFIEADIAIINSCTVTHNADADCRQIVRRILGKNPTCRIIVTGCYAISSPGEIKAISPQIEIAQNKNRIFPPETDICSTISYFYKHTRAFVKIQDGCNAYCSYCIVPYVRRELYSKPKEVVFNEIQLLLRNGYNRFVLCGIRLGKYKNNSNYKLVNLIEDILKINKNIQLELSSLELEDITDELIELIANSNRIIHHLHIPLQSADNRILKLMNRPYTAEEFQIKLDKIYSKVPDISITTDVMVGFPTETQTEFATTLEFIKRNKFAKVHIFRYSNRPKTLASSLKPQVSSQEIKNRLKFLQAI